MKGSEGGSDLWGKGGGGVSVWMFMIFVIVIISMIGWLVGRSVSSLVVNRRDEMRNGKRREKDIRQRRGYISYGDREGGIGNQAIEKKRRRRQ